ncbi:hypothetical protein [Alteribacter natronophilus]|uniref:hypothetical protein n=1 Tax=Alteribacter natronophilus TaxID=2583810 RepID=UPI00110D6138|nr:hypothetical protein [Alteribacter natronophilus]TMW73408.1 hypothetical protein FGB90_03640 [Alteribacter natronophilus]
MNMIKLYSSSRRKAADPDELEELFFVLEHFYLYSEKQHYRKMKQMQKHILQRYPDFCAPPSLAMPQVLAWTRFCAGICRGGKTIYQYFLEHHLPKLNLTLSPFTEFMLTEWQYVFPGFYYPSISVGTTGRLFEAEDMFNGELKTVIAFNQTFTPPEKGTIMTGLLLPLGDGRFTPVLDLLQVHPSDRNKAAGDLSAYAHSDPSLYFDQLAVSDYPEFLHILLRHLKSH